MFFFPFPNNINQPFRRTLTLYISKWQTDQIQFHLSVITAVILLNYYFKKRMVKKPSNTCSRSETVTILFLLRLCVIYCFINTREESQKHVWVHRTIPAPPPPPQKHVICRRGATKQGSPQMAASDLDAASRLICKANERTAANLIMRK